MLAKGLDRIINQYGSDFTEWEYSDKFKAFRKPVTIPYVLVLKTDVWIGNFERELVGYALGILDGVQMDRDFAYAQRRMFWKEVFEKETPIRYEDEYELHDKYLLETFQICDDWEQITFYNVKSCGDRVHSELKIQFAQLPPLTWRSIIIPRIEQFFEKYATTLTNNGNIVDLCFKSADDKDSIFYIKNKERVLERKENKT